MEIPTPFPALADVTKGSVIRADIRNTNVYLGRAPFAQIYTRLQTTKFFELGLSIIYIHEIKLVSAQVTKYIYECISKTGYCWGVEGSMFCLATGFM